jgi:anti-sigma regulatory factor (Ser/Thr protein kinase)
VATVSSPAAAEDLWIAVDDASAVATARRRGAALATATGLDDDRVGEVEIITSELATNLVKHGGGGDLLVRALPDGGLQVVAVDSGPGTRHLAALADDGVSTTRTLGVGLGAVRRLATRTALWSEPARGAIVVAEIGGPDPADPVAHLVRPIRGETVSGDTVAHRRTPDGWLVLVADGLGHGPLAAEASRRAAEVFHAGPDSPADLVRRMHAALAGTRGAAVAVCRVDERTRTASHAGIGNISGRLLGGRRARVLISQPGIVGHKLPRVQELRHPLEDARLLVLHSDGLTEKWDAAQVPDVDRFGPTVCAAQLLRDAGTRRDDASVLTVRVAP